jgi:6-pyruvoyltetrahydropterin/6-carboxytetrahydropterin synthase
MGTRGEFKVAITKEDLVFAAAHFITFAGHRCEKLHGHNYRASLFVEGGLEADSWFVVDFSAVKRVMRALTAELDHRVLLPATTPSSPFRGERRRVAFDGQPRYVSGGRLRDPSQHHRRNAGPVSCRPRALWWARCISS